MKVTVQQAAFAAALDAVCKGISKDNTNPIYGGVLIEVDGDALALTSMNSMRSIMCRIPANIDEIGSVVLPGDLLAKTVAKMPDSPVSLLSDGSGTSVRCGRARLRLNSLEVRRFDTFPVVEPTASISVPRLTFVTMANKACRYVMKEQAGSPECMGVHIIADHGTLRMQSTDSYRYFEASAKVDVGGFDAIIDVTSIRDMASMAPGDTIEIGVSENQVTLSSGSVSYIGRAIYGRFPNIALVMPSDFATEATFDPRDAMAALSRIDGIARQNGRVELTTCDSTISLRASSPESGEAVEEFDANLSGPKVRIGLANQFLADGLKSMGDVVNMGFNGASNPSVMRSEDVCDVMYLMMPTRL